MKIVKVSQHAAYHSLPEHIYWRYPRRHWNAKHRPLCL